MLRLDSDGPDDLRAMQRAVQQTWSAESRWHVGDLAWARYSLPDQEGRRRIVRWEDDGLVAAWGWAELSGHLDLYTHPDYPRIADDVLAWFDEVATGIERLVTVMETDTDQIRALDRAGFREVFDGPRFEHCQVRLGAPLRTPRLPAGYRVRPVREDEVEARADVHRAAWKPRRLGELHQPPFLDAVGESSMTAESYRTLMTAWPYRADLDLVVEGPGGCLVASALGWLDEANAVGELEPVGTDPAHARRGLGSAVSVACLNALRAAGATQAMVYPRGDPGYPVPRRLYHTLGFRPVAQTVTYARA